MSSPRAASSRPARASSEGVTAAVRRFIGRTRARARTRDHSPADASTAAVADATSEPTPDAASIAAWTICAV